MELFAGLVELADGKIALKCVPRPVELVDLVEGEAAAGDFLDQRLDDVVDEIAVPLGHTARIERCGKVGVLRLGNAASGLGDGALGAEKIHFPILRLAAVFVADRSAGATNALEDGGRGIGQGFKDTLVMRCLERAGCGIARWRQGAPARGKRQLLAPIQQEVP